MSILNGTESSVSILNDLEVLGMAFECAEKVGARPLPLKAKGRVTDTQKSAAGHDHKRIAAAPSKIGCNKILQVLFPDLGRGELWISHSIRFDSEDRELKVKAIGILIRLLYAYCCSLSQHLLKLPIVYRVEDGGSRGIDPRVTDLSIK
jgi:hypothetical protein